ncbi:MAG: DoxX family protein [Comamonas sp.]
MLWNSTQNVFALVGRVLMSFLFIPAGISKIGGFAGAVGYASSVGMPLPEVGVGIGLLIELVGGIALLLGWNTRWAALVLAFFTLVASFFFHAYWGLPADQAGMQQLLFNKNVAVVGGLLAFAAFGAGAFSVDGRRRTL